MSSPARKRSPTALVSRSLLILISGQIIATLAGLVYGKMTAVYISPGVWGDYSLLFVAMTLLYGLFITPTLQSFKAALGQFPEQQAITFYKQRLIWTCLTLSLPALLAGLYYQNPIFGLIWIAAIGQCTYQFSSNYLNALGQHGSYTLLQAGYGIGTVLVFALVVIGLNNYTVTGLWQAVMLVNTLLAVVAGWRFVWDNRSSSIAAMVNHSIELARAYRQYVRPLLSLASWGWLINYADRYLIRLYLTDVDVGQYTMGYSLGSKILLLVAPLLAYLSPQVLHLRATGQSPKTANLLIGRYLIRYVLFAGSGCLLFYAGREWIGRLLLSDRYEQAFLVGPTVAVGYLLLTSIHLLELKWYAFGQTRYVLWHNVVGAFLTIGFNLLLIPSMGILGAALATVLGFAGQFLLAGWLFLFAKPANQ